MRPDALTVLRRNREEIRQMQQDCTDLENGILRQAAALSAPQEIPAVFREMGGQTLCSAEFASLCRAACEGETDLRILSALLPEEYGEEPPLDTRTAYLRNAYTDRAFAVFSRHIERLSAQYQPSFTAGCEEVYYGRCSYCILPIRNSEDGMLTSFTRMMTKYDLKIARICDVVSQDGESTIRYALLRRGLELSVPRDGLLQITAVLPSDVHCGQFLAACEKTGASVESLTTLPLRYTNEITSLSICFRIGKNSTLPLLCFLTQALESCTVDGIYNSCGE